MSANLYWTPAKRKMFELNISAPSSFMEQMERAFGNRNPSLDSSAIPVLKGMRAANHEQLHEAFDELIEAIDKHDIIEIKATY
jgi:hypothetical protein